jgi:hypothetical protein
VALVERAVKDQFARIVLQPLAGVESHTQLLVLLIEPTQLALPPPLVPETAARRGGKK